MTQLFANNAYGSLGATLSDSATSLTLATGQGARFPTPTGGDHFLVTLVGLDSNGNENAWEIVRVTGCSTDALTIVRAQEGTTAATWVAGTRVEVRSTAGTFDSFTDTAQAAAAAPVQSVFGRTGAVVLGSGDVTGALGFTPENAANKGIAGGYASLDGSGLVPASQLPSYVDDVLEYANYAALPGIGVSGKIYVLATPYTSGGITSSQFRWSGSAYAPIVASPGTTDAVTEGSGNLYFTNARAQAALAGLYLPSVGGTLTGDLTLSGTGRRIIADFSNATYANRLMFQTSTANGTTSLGVIPNGTGTTSRLFLFNNADPTNASFLHVGMVNDEARIWVGALGSGTNYPLVVQVGGSEALRVATSKNFLIGTTIDDGANKLQVNGGVATTGNLTFSGTGQRITGDFSNSTLASRLMFQTSTANGNTGVYLIPNGTAQITTLRLTNSSDPANTGYAQLQINSTDVSLVAGLSGTGTYLPFSIVVGGSEAIRIPTATRNLLVGATTDDGTNKLQVNGGAAISGKLTVSSSGEMLKLLSSGDVSSTGLTYLRFYDSTGARGYLGYAGTANTLTLATGSASTLELQATTYEDFVVGGARRARLSSGSFQTEVDIIANGNKVIGINGTGVAAGTFAFRNSSGVQKSAIGSFYNIADEGNLEFISGSSTSMALTSSGVLDLKVGQVKFPATQNASSDANTLDDYEEGTWTPALANCGSPTYTENYGRYIKIGRQVTIVMKVAVTGATLTGNRMLLTGLPFTAQDPADAAQRVSSRLQGDWQAMGGYAATSGMFRIDSGAQLEGVRDNGSGYSVYWTYSELGSSSFEFALSFTYFAAS